MEPRSIRVPPVATSVFIWSALLLTTGCAGHDSATNGAPIPLEGICAVYLDDLCTALVQCTDSVYASVDECRADNVCGGFAGLKKEIAGGGPSTARRRRAAATPSCAPILRVREGLHVRAVLAARAGRLRRRHHRQARRRTDLHR